MIHVRPQTSNDLKSKIETSIDPIILCLTDSEKTRLQALVPEGTPISLLEDYLHAFFPNIRKLSPAIEPVLIQKSIATAGKWYGPIQHTSGFRDQILDLFLQIKTTYTNDQTFIGNMGEPYTKHVTTTTVMHHFFRLQESLKAWSAPMWWQKLGQAFRKSPPASIPRTILVWGLSDVALCQQDALTWLFTHHLETVLFVPGTDTHTPNILKWIQTKSFLSNSQLRTPSAKPVSALIFEEPDDEITAIEAAAAQQPLTVLALNPIYQNALYNRFKNPAEPSPEFWQLLKDILGQFWLLLMSRFDQRHVITFLRHPYLRWTASTPINGELLAQITDLFPHDFKLENWVDGFKNLSTQYAQSPDNNALNRTQKLFLKTQNQTLAQQHQAIQHFQRHCESLLKSNSKAQFSKNLSVIWELLTPQKSTLDIENGLQQFKTKLETDIESLSKLNTPFNAATMIEELSILTHKLAYPTPTHPAVTLITPQDPIPNTNPLWICGWENAQWPALHPPSYLADTTGARFLKSRLRHRSILSDIQTLAASGSAITVSSVQMAGHWHTLGLPTQDPVRVQKNNPQNSKKTPESTAVSLDLPQHPLPLDALSATTFEAYQRCKYRFFIETVLGLQPLEALHADVDASIWGTFIHELMSEAGALPESDFFEAVPKIAKQFDNGTLQWRLKLKKWAQKEPIPGVLSKFIETRDNSPWRFNVWETEWPFEQKADPLIQSQLGFSLKGRIDAILKNPSGRLAVLDYKTGRSIPTYTDIAQFKSLQLSIYAWVLSLAMPENPVIGGIIFHLNEKEKVAQKVMFCTQDSREETFHVGRTRPMILTDTFFKELVTHLRFLYGELKSGNFTSEPLPHMQKDQSKTCRYCAYKAQCRYKERFGS